MCINRTSPWIALCLLLATSAASAQESDATFTEVVRPFLRQHCQRCHGQELAESDLRLDTLGPDFRQRQSLGHWVEVLDRLNLGKALG